MDRRIVTGLPDMDSEAGRSGRERRPLSHAEAPTASGPPSAPSAAPGPPSAPTVAASGPEEGYGDLVDPRSPVLIDEDWNGGPLWGCPLCDMTGRNAGFIERHMASVHVAPSPVDRAAAAGIIIPPARRTR